MAILVTRYELLLPPPKELRNFNIDGFFFRCQTRLCACSLSFHKYSFHFENTIFDVPSGGDTCETHADKVYFCIYLLIAKD